MNNTKKAMYTNDENITGYKNNRFLVKHLEERLHFEKRKLKLKIAGEDLSKDDQRKNRKLKRMKNYYLNKHIFPSMANLVVFFEYVSKNPELQAVFDEDIYELLLGGSKNGSEQVIIYRRFLESTIRWDVKKDPKNFRLALIYTLQNIIYQNLPFILNNIMMDETYTTEMSNMVRQDLSRAYLWAKIIGSKTEYQSNKPGRYISF